MPDVMQAKPRRVVPGLINMKYQAITFGPYLCTAGWAFHGPYGKKQNELATGSRTVARNRTYCEIRSWTDFTGSGCRNVPRSCSTRICDAGLIPDFLFCVRVECSYGPRASAAFPTPAKFKRNEINKYGPYPDYLIF